MNDISSTYVYYMMLTICMTSLLNNFYFIYAGTRVSGLYICRKKTSSSYVRNLRVLLIPDPGGTSWSQRLLSTMSTFAYYKMLYNQKDQDTSFLKKKDWRHCWWSVNTCFNGHNMYVCQFLHRNRDIWNKNAENQVLPVYSFIFISCIFYYQLCPPLHITKCFTIKRIKIQVF
jgi:hypothetical protein